MQAQAERSGLTSMCQPELPPLLSLKTYSMECVHGESAASSESQHCLKQAWGERVCLSGQLPPLMSPWIVLFCFGVTMCSPPTLHCGPFLAHSFSPGLTQGQASADVDSTRQLRL